MNPEIRIKVLNIDHGDDTIHFQAFFNNGFCSTTLAFYGYSDEFQDFGKKLAQFPETIKDKVTYELGEKGEHWAFYLLMEAYCFKENGKSALKIEAINNGIGPTHHESKFEIESEPAALNRLGNSLQNWNPLEEKYFEWILNE